MKRTLFVFDIDGTLACEHCGEIPKSTRWALEQLKNQGHELVVATGRPLNMCAELREIGINHFIIGNGILIESNNEVLFKQEFKKEDVKRLRIEAEKLSIGIGFFTKEFHVTSYPSPGLEEALLTSIKLRVRPSDLPENKIEEICGMGCYGSQEHVEILKGKFPQWRFNQWNSCNCDIFSMNISKAHSLDILREKLGFDKEDVIAFGDGRNDLELISYAQIGVAMGNAHADVKKIASCVTENASHDGIWKELVRRNYLPKS